MPSAARDKDITTGHGCWPPTIIKGRSSNLLINNRQAAVLFNSIVVHCCPLPFVPCKCHSGFLVGVCRVIHQQVRPLQKVGDTITCCPSTDRVGSGSTNVVIGG